MKYGVEVNLNFPSLFPNKWGHWKWYKSKKCRDTALQSLNESHRKIAKFRAKGNNGKEI